MAIPDVSLTEKRYSSKNNDGGTFLGGQAVAARTSGPGNQLNSFPDDTSNNLKAGMSHSPSLPQPQIATVTSSVQQIGPSQ